MKSFKINMESFKINGLREKRIEDLALLILFLMVESILIGLILIILFKDYVFSVILVNIIFFMIVGLFYKRNFVTLAQFIVDSEYNKLNLYETESKAVEQSNNEYRVLTHINIFNDIGFDSPNVKEIKDYNNIKLEIEWARTPDGAVPPWNGLSLISRYAINMILNRIY